MAVVVLKLGRRGRLNLFKVAHSTRKLVHRHTTRIKLSPNPETRLDVLARLLAVSADQPCFTVQLRVNWARSLAILPHLEALAGGCRVEVVIVLDMASLEVRSVDALGWEIVDTVGMALVVMQVKSQAPLGTQCLALGCSDRDREAALTLPWALPTGTRTTSTANKTAAST